jgi:formate hydrogenlyase subunit 6/NADH:ubiquinone oxidoreductase subunit I
MPLDVVRRLLAPLREPIVTSRYPDTPPRLQEATRGLPEVDPARCERDGACVKVCPTGAINLAEIGWSIDAGLCVFCGLCADACRPGAIRLGRRVELAGSDRAALVELTALENRP